MDVPAKVEIKPWIGRSFSQSMPRILVLGDSHHGDNGSDYEDFTIDTINSYFERTQPSFAFFTRIMATIANCDHWLVDKKKFYNSIIFMNLAEGVPVVSSGLRPSEKSFAEGTSKLSVMIEEYAPDIVFCCGRDVERVVHSNFSAEAADSVSCDGLTANVAKIGASFFFFSKHPSWSYRRAWRDVFQSFVDEIGMAQQMKSAREQWSIS